MPNYSLFPRADLLELLFPSLVWRIPSEEKVLYLSFDDGPVPGVTPWVLQQLDACNAKATFFCVGNNVIRHPDIYKSVLDHSHSTGNHTMNHLNAWKVNAALYKKDVAAASEVIPSGLFRPPYGKLTPGLIRTIRRNYSIIMWDVLSRDYDPSLTGNDCFSRIRKSAQPGSVIVFHDSMKAEKRLRVALPAVLDFYSSEGYQFKAIMPVSNLQNKGASSS